MNNYPKPSRATVKKLKAIRAQVLAEPCQFNMSYFFWTPAPELARAFVGYEIPNCGTAACFAGWTISNHLKVNPREAEYLRHAKFGKQSTRGVATKILGITDDQAVALFYVEHWPYEFLTRWQAISHQQRDELAAVAVARLDHFIKTGR